MDDKTCEVINLFSLLKKVAGLSKQRASLYGLNNLDTIILHSIDKSKGLTQKDLVEKFKAPKQTINSKVMNLKEKDLIKMVPDPKDKRSKILVLSPKGEEEVREIFDSLAISNRDLYDDLGESKIKEIEANLIELIEALEKNMERKWIWKVY